MPHSCTKNQNELLKGFVISQIQLSLKNWVCTMYIYVTDILVYVDAIFSKEIVHQGPPHIKQELHFWS